jgi:sterol-4alpha-carboxylate 3-dehydrogenase (decarboxylating)
MFTRPECEHGLIFFNLTQHTSALHRNTHSPPTQSGATAIIHTASPAHNLGRPIYELVNITGTSTIITACQNLGVRKLVYTSTGGVIYDGSHNIITADERIPHATTPLDAYNETKARAETMVIDANSPELLTCAIRPAGIFGEGDRQMISGFWNVVKNGQTKFQIGSNENLADFTYVGNVAHAHLLAVDRLGSGYPYGAFRDPIPTVEISLGNRRVPTSDAHPLGPNTNPSEGDKIAAQKFASGETDPSDLRPVLRNRMDQFTVQANLADDADDSEDTSPTSTSLSDPSKGCQIAGQVFYITNGEPIYFWDFARTIWKQLGHTPPYTIAIPVAIGLLLAALAELWSGIVGKEPGFTKFRVSTASQNRYYDIERARRLLGYEPQTGLVQGMEKWTGWYKGELAKQGSAGESEKTK